MKKRILALLLSLGMLVTALPQNLYAMPIENMPEDMVQEAVVEEVTTTETETTTEEIPSTEAEMETEVSPKEEASVETEVESEEETSVETEVESEEEASVEAEEASAEETEAVAELEETAEESAEKNEAASAKLADVPATASVVDTFNVLDINTTLERTISRYETQSIYFAPETTGYYHLVYQADADSHLSWSKDDNNYAGTLGGQKSIDKVLYLEQGFTYTFKVYTYEEGSYALTMYHGEIESITVETNPTRSSYEDVNYDGLTLRINYTDEMSPDTITSVSEDGYIDAFSIINHFSSEYLMSQYLNWQSIGGGTKPVYELEDGVYTVKANIYDYKNYGGHKPYTLEFPITVERNAISSIEVISVDKTSYQGYLNESLTNNIVVQVNFKDGREPLTISPDDTSELSYGLPIEEPYTDLTTYIDSYLNAGNNPGNTEVKVFYRGMETTFTIEIKDKLYKSMEVELPRTTFYAGCRYKMEDATYYTGGDYIDNFSKMTLHPTDETKEDVIYTNRYAISPGYVNMGLALENESGETYLYSYVDDFIEAGGEYGENILRVSYAGNSLDIPVTIEENPFTSVEIVELPKYTKYIEGSSSVSGLNLSGMVIRATKKDGNTQDFSYDDFVAGKDNYNGASGSRLWTSYTGGHNSISYLEVGKHTVTTVFFGHKATFEIEVIDSAVENFTISTLPSNTIYAVSDNAQALSTVGMKVSFTLDGVEYKDIGWNYQEIYPILSNSNIYGANSWMISSTDVNWNEVGIYPVKVQFAGAEAYFNIEIKSELIKELSIIKTPDDCNGFAGEMGISFYGIVVSVTDLNGIETKYGSGYTEDETITGTWQELIDMGLTYNMNVDWNTPGTYPVTLKYKGKEVSYDYVINESPVSSIEITKYPDNPYMIRTLNSYYPDNYVGMSYTVTFTSGDSFSRTITKEDNGVYVIYEGTKYWFSLGWAKWEIVNGYSLPTIGENSVTMTALGKKMEVPITILENPVKSIEVIEQPEKTKYSKLDNKIDLYGAKFKITFTDNSTDEVIFDEHLSFMTYSNENWYIENKAISAILSDEKITVSFMDKTCDLAIENVGLDEVVESELSDGDILVANIEANGQKCVYKFVPETTGIYYFYSVGSAETIGSLYDAEENILQTNTYGGYDCNFRIEANLEAGKTYYFVAGHMSNYSVGKFIICFGTEYYPHGPVFSLADVEEFEITQVPSTVFRTYEHVFDYDTVYLENCEYKLTFKDGREIQSTFTDYTDTYNNGLCINFFGLKCYAKYKYLDNENCLDTTVDNAMIYALVDDEGSTYFEQEIPITFDHTNPLEKLEIEQMPTNTSINQWQVDDEFSINEFLDGLRIKVTFTDGNIKYMEWEDYWGPSRLEDYYISKSWKETVYDEYYDMNIPVAGNNAIVITYIGQKVEIPITVKEKPYTSIAVKKLPEKTSYYLFEETADLYGLELELTTTSGAKETIAIHEHCRRYQVSEELGYLYASHYGSYVRIRFIGLTCTYDINIKTPAEMAESASEIKAGESKEVTINETSEYAIYKFVPEETAIYSFFSTGEYDTCAYLYDEFGNECAYNDDGSMGVDFYLSYNLTAGKSYYYIAKMLSGGEYGTFTCSLTDGRELTLLENVSLSLNAPVVNEEFSYPSRLEDEPNYTVSISWYGDEDDDYCADYATTHMAKITLKPSVGYKFNRNTEIVLNDKKIAKKSLRTDGSIQFTYTFPYTNCRVSLFTENGASIESIKPENINEGVAYGGEYQFKVTGAEDAANPLIVKVNNKLVKPDNNDIYTVNNVKENIAVSAKILNDAELDDLTRLDFVNNKTLEDSFYATREEEVRYNEVGETSLPVLSSYTEEAKDQFFFGWYKERNASGNGSGQRFTSRSTVPSQSVLQLFAKWGTGIFSRQLLGKTISYKILSLDEDNRLKVQIKDLADVQTASVFNLRKGAASGVSLELPGEITDLSDLEQELGIEFDGAEVTGIASGAFSNVSGVSDVVLPSTITEIESGAFENCTELVSVKIPDSVTSIEAGTFKGCENLVSVNIPDSVTTIADDAFADTSDNLVVTCSVANQELVESALEDAGSKATVEVVEIELSYEYAEKEMMYGSEDFIFTYTVKVNGEEKTDRLVNVSCDNESAYQITTVNNIVTVKPLRSESAILTVEDVASGEKQKISLFVEKCNILTAVTVSDIADVVYSGNAVIPHIVVTRKDTNVTLTEGVDYEVYGYNNVDPGTEAYIVIEGIGNYTGSITKYFTILASKEDKPQEENKNDKVETVTYKITYDLAKGKNHVSNPTSYTAGSVVKLLNPSRKGYTFEGWFIANSKVTEISAAMSGDIIVTAKWKKVSKDITVCKSSKESVYS